MKCPVLNPKPGSDMAKTIDRIHEIFEEFGEIGLLRRISTVLQYDSHNEKDELKKEWLWCKSRFYKNVAEVLDETHKKYIKEVDKLKYDIAQLSNQKLNK